ncbi:hypothetical protein NG799_01930 [Laspinema sp. D1]|uniref:Uncharacterized protein n=1 Tax=Laspinema palackyanum D2a TaxID=2953684 RepID=A0ABT2MNI8_9CYAN|nr:hypothetical protein [Laspinema sp. D2a]
MSSVVQIRTSQFQSSLQSALVGATHPLALIYLRRPRQNQQPVEQFLALLCRIDPDLTDPSFILFPEEGVASPPLVLHQLPNPGVTSFRTGTIPANNKRRQSVGSRDGLAKLPPRADSQTKGLG